MRPPAGYMRNRVGALEDEAMDAAKKAEYDTVRELAQRIVDGKSDCSAIPNYKVAERLLLDNGDKALADKLATKCQAKAEADQQKQAAKQKTSPWLYVAGAAAFIYAIYRFVRTNP